LTRTTFALCAGALLTGALLTGAGGCGSSSSATTAKEPEPPPPPRAKSAIELLPVGADIVIGINLAQLRSSALFKELAPIIDEMARDGLQKFEQACGVHAYDAIDSLLIAVDTDAADSEEVTVVIGGVTRRELDECGQALAQAEGQQLQSTHDGDFTELVADGESVWLAWLDDHTFVTRGEMPKVELETRLRGDGNITGDAVIMGLIENVATDAGFWAVAGKESGFVPAVDSMYATADTTTGLKLDAGVHAPEPETVTNMADSAHRQMSIVKGLHPLGRYLERVEINTQGNDLYVKLDLSETEVVDIVRTALDDPMFKALIGG